ncbi:MAG TPA: hypothetical protein VJ997_06680 [Longimicrobiales bacterium]|nr:hypothetical protein [Longimicrobiales bacterium]
MRKLILLVVLWFAVTYYFPDSRHWLAEITKPLWTPIVTWDTREEMRQVAQDVIAQEQFTGKLPDRRGWLEWLDYRYPVDDLKKDPWGSTYQLKVWADSVAIWSYGPDRTRDTGDDFQVSVPRERRGR